MRETRQVIDDYTGATQALLTAIRQGDIEGTTGYLVGLDRPALLAPDPAALLASRRRDEILAGGHRWRVVTEALWNDLLALGRERPLQRVYVVEMAAIESWIESPDTLDDLATDGWRADQGTKLIVPIVDRED